MSTTTTAKADREKTVFDHHWPHGIEAGAVYEVLCDDKGRNGQAWLRVFVAQDGDVHVMMHEQEELDDPSSPFPTIRVRTGIGGGRSVRTRQALLWLARAIQLDAAESSACSVTPAPSSHE